MQNNLKNRRGTFRVQCHNINRARDGDVEAMACWNEIFRDVLVFHAEYRYDADSIVYSGYSLRFDPIEEGCVMPVYDVQVTRSQREHGIIEFNAEFKKEAA